MTYVPSGNPASGSQGLSAPIRAEFAAIGAAFTVFPRITTTGLFDTVFAQVGSFTFTLPSAPGTLAMVANVAAEATTRAAADALLAPKASPALTGVPTAPTAAPLTNTTQLSTTAFTTAAVGVEATNRATAVTAEATARAAVGVQSLNNVGRNLLHNPLFNVAQRGVGPFTTTGYTVDRWAISITSDTAGFQPQALNDGSRIQIGDEAATTFLAATVTGSGAAGAFTVLYQPIEGVRRLAAKTVTVSFWAVGTSGGLKLGVSLDQVFGTGGSPSAAVRGAGQSITTTTSYVRYSLTFTLPSVAGKTFGTAGDDQTTLLFWYSSGVTNATRAGNIGVQSGTVNIWGVQLEVAPTASQLEKPDLRYDLANCQRFFQSPVSFVLFAGGVAGQAFAGTVPLAAMRALPTITLLSSTNVNTSGFTGVGASASAAYISAVAVATAGTGINCTFSASADL